MFKKFKPFSYSLFRLNCGTDVCACAETARGDKVYISNMVKGCSVYGCTNRSNGSARDRGVKFFKFPKGKIKRRAWIRSLNRRNWQPTENSFVCSDHFVSGWHADEREDVDFAPTVFKYKAKGIDEERSNRAFRRNLTKVNHYMQVVYYKIVIILLS